MSYEITFGGRFQAGLGITTGKVVVKAGSLYLPATTANVALYPIAGLVVRYQQVPSANYDVGDIAHAGVWPSSLTGLTAATAGVDTYARITSTGSLENTTAPAYGDWLMGRINTDGDLILTGATQYANVTGGVQVVVDIRDYGAVCDGVTDDSDAWDAVMEDVPILGIDVIEVPKTAGGCAISRPIRMCSTDPNYLMNGVTIRGQLSTPAIAPALTYLVWLADRRSGAAASMTASAGDVEPGADYLGITWTHFLLSGCTGANFTAADVGTTGVRISGAADTTLNCQARITKYVSATSVYVAIPDQAAISDANNGAISWLVLDSMIYMQGRALSVEGLSPNIPSGKYVYNFISYTHPTGESNQLSVTECAAKGIKSITYGTGVIENILEVGQWIVPTTTQVGWAFTFQTAANGQYRPWGPTQCDYFTLENALNEGGGTTYDGACIRSANPSGQSRGNVGINIGSLFKEYVTLERSDFPNSNGPASSVWSLDKPTGGQISVAMFGRTSGQAQMVIKNMQWEIGTVLLKTFGSSGTAFISTRFEGGYAQLSSSGSYPMSPLGIFQITDGSHLEVNGLPLDLSGLSHNGVLLTSTAVGRASVSFRGCILPHWTTLQKNSLREMFSLSSGASCSVQIKDCTMFRSGVGMIGLDDRTIIGSAYGVVDNVDESAGLIGLTTSQFAASNLATTITFSGTETVKVWPFTRPEEDETFSGHYYEVQCVPIAVTGSPAATVARVRSNGKARRGVVIEMPTAPGGGNTVTFLCTLIRHNAPALTAFHPLQIAGLTHWYDADCDWRYTVPVSKKLQDPGAGTVGSIGYWRSQATTRGLDGNKSVYDLQALSNSESNMPDTRSVSAGYNNKYVITSAVGDICTVSTSASYPTQGSPLWCLIAGNPGSGSGTKIPSQMYAALGGGLDVAHIVANGTSTVGIICDQNVGVPYGFTYAYNWSGKEVVLAEFNGASSALYISAKTAVATGTTGTLASSSNGIVTCFDSIFETHSWAGSSSGILKHVMWGSGTLTTAEKDGLLDWVGADVGKSIGA